MRRAGAALAVSLLTLLLLTPSASAASKLSKQIAAAKAAANAAAAQLSRAETALALAERDLDEATGRTATTKARVEALSGRVKALAVHRYMNAGLEVATRDPNAFARNDALVRFVTLGMSDALEAFRVAKADFDSNREALRARLKSRKDAVAKLRAQQRAAIAQLERLGALMKREEAASRASRSSRARGILVTGNWVCPVQGPHSFSNDWGAPRSGGRRTHQGNDILAPRGTPVVANVAGSWAKNFSNLGGNSYFLKGRDGNTYFGAHLESYAGGGGAVAAGQVIGYVGTTGDARGGPPHLHFEIHPGGGGAVNPYPTLVKYC